MTKEIKIMSIQNRIAKLKGKDPVVNANIIKKLERELRALQA